MGVTQEKGVEFNLKYSFEGHKQDWEQKSRWGKPGHAQRFQCLIMEPYKETTKKNINKTWYRW